MMVSFVLSFFPRYVLDEILNLIESVSEDFPSYSWNNRVVPGNQTTNCAYSDRLPFAQTYLCICCLRISSYTFYPDEDTRREHKMHVQLCMTH